MSATLRFSDDTRTVFDPDAAAVSEMRESVMRSLDAAEPGSVVYLDLNETTFSASALAALLAPLLRFRATPGHNETFLVIEDPSGRNLWDADAALRKESEDTRSKLVCVWRTTNDLGLVGAVDPSVQATYTFACSEGADGATARKLAEVDGISIQAASNRLAKLVTLGLIHQTGTESVAGGGNQFRFVAVG